MGVIDNYVEIQKLKEDGGGSSGSYSTEEKVIGTWVDGSTLYEKTIVDDTIYDSTKTFQMDEKVLFYDVVVIAGHSSDDASYLHLPRVNFEYPDSKIDISSIENKISIRPGSDYPIYGSKIFKTFINIKYLK